MSRNPVTVVRRGFTWLVMLTCIIAAAFNLWVAANGSWPGWVAAVLLLVFAGFCFRSLWKEDKTR